LPDSPLGVIRYWQFFTSVLFSGFYFRNGVVGCGES